MPVAGCRAPLEIDSRGRPRGLTEPLSVAETLATFVAGLAGDYGRRAQVVKVLSAPKLVPPPLVATIRK